MDWLNAKLPSGKQVKVQLAELIIANGGTMEARGDRLSPQQCVTLAHMHGMYNGFLQAHMENEAHIAASKIILREACNGLKTAVPTYSEADLKNINYKR